MDPSNTRSARPQCPSPPRPPRPQSNTAQRNLPTRGFAPRYLVLGMFTICAYGFYETMQGIKERREMARERIWARIHLTPVLQAENDRDDVRRHFAAEAREKELMKDVKGWEFGSVYNSKRYVLPGVNGVWGFGC